MRIVSDGPEAPRDPELVEAARILMAKLRFDGTRGQEDYRLQPLTRYCLRGDGAAAAVREICNRLGESVGRHQTHASYHEGLIDALFTQHALAALEGFCSGLEAAGVGVASGIAELTRLRTDPISHLTIDELVRWCDEDPAARYPAAASVVQIFGASPASGGPGWSSSALTLLAKAPDKIEVLKRFIERFSPWTWTGPRSATVASNAILLDQLDTTGDPALAEFISDAKASLARAVDAERGLESYIFGTEHQSFE
jgi:hypothetical protein